MDYPFYIENSVVSVLAGSVFLLVETLGFSIMNLDKKCLTAELMGAFVLLIIGPDVAESSL